MNVSNYIAQQFAAPKGQGGSLVSHAMNRQNRPLYDATIRLLCCSDCDNVLDIGCGNGYVLDLLARQYNAIFAGIDPSASIIKTAMRRNHKHKKMSFHCQDASALSFPDELFSKAYTINTVYFWQNLNRSMLEIQRVLCPGGTFINTLYTNETLARFSHTQFGYRRYDPKELIQAGTNAGFAVKAVPLLHAAATCYIYQKPTNGVI